MNEPKNEALQLQQLIAKITTHENVSKNLKEGKNGFFLRGMRCFKYKLFSEIKREKL